LLFYETLTFLACWYLFCCFTRVTLIAYVHNMVSRVQNVQMDTLKPFCAWQQYCLYVSLTWASESVVWGACQWMYICIYILMALHLLTKLINFYYNFMFTYINIYYNFIVMYNIGWISTDQISMKLCRHN